MYDVVVYPIRYEYIFASYSNQSIIGVVLNFYTSKDNAIKNLIKLMEIFFSTVVHNNVWFIYYAYVW